MRTSRPAWVVGSVALLLGLTIADASYALANAPAVFGHVIAAPSLSLSRTVGPPASQVTAKGKGFGRREVVVVNFGSTRVAKSRTSLTGSFSASFKVPMAARPGSYTVKASGQTSKRTASAAFRVTRPVIAYVTGYFSGAVTPINTATNRTGKPIAVGTGAATIVITPNGKTAYVAHSAGGCVCGSTVTPINTVTNKAGQPIEAGSGSMAITPNGKTVYVANIISGTVIPISTATNKPGKAINAGAYPTLIAITPDGKTAYVTNYGIPFGPGFGEGDTVTPINIATNKAGKPITVPAGPADIAITPNGKTAYVTSDGGDCQCGDTVTPINTATNQVGTPITVPGQPDAIAITPNGKTAYVDNGRQVIPISTATNKPGKPITVGDNSAFPSAIAITPNGKTVYIATSINGVIPISTATNKPGKPITVGPQPNVIAITPDGLTAYVLSGAGVPGTVFPINTATNKAGKAITVGPGPFDIAFTP